MKEIRISIIILGLCVSCRPGYLCHLHQERIRHALDACLNLRKNAKSIGEPIICWRDILCYCYDLLSAALRDKNRKSPITPSKCCWNLIFAAGGGGIYIFAIYVAREARARKNDLSCSYYYIMTYCCRVRYSRGLEVIFIK